MKSKGGLCESARTARCEIPSRPPINPPFLTGCCMKKEVNEAKEPVDEKQYVEQDHFCWDCGTRIPYAGRCHFCVRRDRYLGDER